MEIQSNLIPGSVWNRPKKNGDVSKNTVLLVTNQGCSERVLEANPHQVVFMSEQLQVLSMPIEQFLRGRTYSGIDSVVAATVELLTSEEEDDDDDDIIDLDDVQPDEKLFENMLASAEADDDTSSDSEDAPTSSSLSLRVGPHPLAPKLEAAFVGYSESPYYTGDTLHTLRFSLEEISINEVASSFYLADPNAIQTFEVTIADEAQKIEVNAYLNTMLEANGYERFAVLYILTEGDYRAPMEVPSATEEVVEYSIATPEELVNSSTLTRVDSPITIQVS